MTLATVSESLAGRIALHTLYPFCWPELLEKPHPMLFKDLFQATTARELLKRLPKPPKRDYRAQIMERVLTGGIPRLS